MVKPLTDREEEDFVLLRGFDQINGDDTRGIDRTRSNDSPTLSSSSIKLPNTPRSIKKSLTKL
jgi:hypothetical protein